MNNDHFQLNDRPMRDAGIHEVGGGWNALNKVVVILPSVAGSGRALARPCARVDKTGVLGFEEDVLERSGIRGVISAGNL